MSSDVVERAKYCREWGNFDALHEELLAEVERLRAAATRIEEIAEDTDRERRSFMRDRNNPQAAEQITYLGGERSGLLAARDILRGN